MATESFGREVPLDARFHVSDFDWHLALRTPPSLAHGAPRKKRRTTRLSGDSYEEECREASRLSNASMPRVLRVVVTESRTLGESWF